MVTKKEYFKKRWLYFISLLFTFIFPLVIIIENLLTIEKVDKKISLQFCGVILGLVYICFISKKLKKYISDLKMGATKVFLSGITDLIPFITLACIIFLVENVLTGFSTAVWLVVLSMAIGLILKMIEYFMNKNFLYQLEIYDLAKKEIDIEQKKNELREELQ